jgi:hypothetical protein
MTEKLPRSTMVGPQQSGKLTLQRFIVDSWYSNRSMAKVAVAMVEPKELVKAFINEY